MGIFPHVRIIEAKPNLKPKFVIREVKNRFGSISVQLISKHRGRHKVVKTIACATTLHNIEELKILARKEKATLEAQPSLFSSEQDDAVEQNFSS